MTNENEQALIRKVDDIHAVLVGPMGQEQDGLLYRVRNQDARLRSLEKLRWYAAGIMAAILFLFEVTKIIG
jgi:hypothetical protein